MLLYQSRMGPKKPNLTIAWAGPYQIDWVYTNGSVKLVDLAGLALPGYYNASKIKHYDYVQEQVSTPARQGNDEEIDINIQELFQEPTVGSVELVDEYDKLWAAVLDETTSSVSGDSMITAQEGWNSDSEERNQAVDDQQEEEIFQEPANDQLEEALPGTKDKGQVPGDSESTKAGTPSVMRENHLLDECLKGEVIHERGSNLFNWFNLKLSQCMSATWINGNKKREINTLDSRDLRDLTEHSLMMDKSSRDSQDTKDSKIHAKFCKDTLSVSQSLFFFAITYAKSSHLASTSTLVSISHTVLYKHCTYNH